MVSTITFEPSIQPNELRSLGATWQSRLELEELSEVRNQGGKVCFHGLHLHPRYRLTLDRPSSASFLPQTRPPRNTV